MVADRRFIPGSFYRRDDRSGAKVRSFDTTKEWNGLWIKTSQSEGRQPQDFVRGVADEQAVPEPRPTATPIFLGPLTTTLSANAAAGATTISVALSTRMLAGDVIEVLCGTLDGAFQFRTTISSVPTSTSIILVGPLPYAAPSGNLVTDITASATVSAANLPASNGGGPF